MWHLFGFFTWHDYKKNSSLLVDAKMELFIKRFQLHFSVMQPFIWMFVFHKLGLRRLFICFVTLCMSLHAGVDIFRRRIQAFRLVPHSGPVWLLLHVRTRGASAHTGQAQKVNSLLVSHDTHDSSFVYPASWLPPITDHIYRPFFFTMCTKSLIDVFWRYWGWQTFCWIVWSSLIRKYVYFPVFQDTREDLHDYSLFNSGHYGPVQYLPGLLELPHTGYLQVL